MSMLLRLDRRPRPAFACAAAAIAFLALTSAQAKAQSRPAAPPSQPAAPPTTQESRPAYEPQLLRLAEIIGALSYLRDLCGENDGEAWRAKMASLLAAEAGADSERERLAGAFNKGFTGYALTYRTCTANAQVVIARYLNEGERLTRDVESRYGGG